MSTELLSDTIGHLIPVNDNRCAAPSCDEILGVRFHHVSIESAVDCIEGFIAEGIPKHVCLCNAYTISICWKDSLLRRVLDRADLVLADGMSIVWGGRCIGVSLPGRVAGPDLTEALCANAEQKGHRVYFLGSTPETLGLLRRTLLSRWPTLKIVGMHSPPMCEQLHEEDNQTIIQDIFSAKPDILFVGMSSPKQEKWIAANLEHLPVPVSIGIGAAFDFLSGQVPRAPRLFQESGFEWLYRLYREPRRLWKRYLLGNAIFLSHLGMAWFRIRRQSFTEEE